ncbi:MAG: hypothetical protein ACFFG0_48695 [Candidatus Thorarchaeota archaeon]
MEPQYRKYYSLGLFDIANNLHEYFFKIFNIIYKNHMYDTGMFNHNIIPSFIVESDQKTCIYIKYSTTNIQQAIDKISKHNKTSSKIVIIILENAEKLYPLSFYAYKNILLISGEAFELIKEEILVENENIMKKDSVIFFPGYYNRILRCFRRILNQTSRKLLKKDDLSRIIYENRRRYKKCA